VGRIFTAAIDADGKQQFKNVYGKTRKQVADKLRELAKQKELYGFVSTKKVSVAEWIEHWITEIMMHSLRKTTYQTYLSLFKTHIKLGFGGILLQKLSSADIQKLYNKLTKEGKRIQVKKQKKGKDASPPPEPQGFRRRLFVRCIRLSGKPE
jgi:flagellar biosynthesis component FlhA